MPEPRPQAGSTPRWAVFAVLLGVYLSVHGYQSFEVDQAYRLPLLLHRQDASLYANDPFVRAFDTFNPHIGYVALLDVISRLVGLSAALAGLYFVMFGVAAAGIDRLARSVWPAAGSRVGFVAMGLVLLARAGNIGTNHLFESMLLDRGMAFALGWVALGSVVDRPDRGGWLAALAIGLAGLIHPSVGMQLAMLLAATWVVWGFLRTRTGVEPKRAVVGIGWIVVAMIPCVWLHAGQQGRLLEGLPAEEFRLLSVFVQSPQHMLPHLWLTPQWLAWACYPILAVLALWDRGEVGKGSWPAARVRLAAILAVNLVGLAAAWFAIEEVHNLRVTVFQPFRMATVLRGLALIPLAGRVLMLWQRGDRLSRVRATLLAVGLTGDWSLVVVTAVELTMVATSGVPAGSLVSMAVLAGSLVFLSRHDTESGHWRLLAGLGVILAYDGLMRRATRQTRTMPRPHLVLGGPDSLRGREVPLEIGHQGSQRSLRRLLRLRRPDKQVVRASLDEAIAGRGCLGDEEIREGEAPAEPSMAPAARQEPRPPRKRLIGVSLVLAWAIPMAAMVAAGLAERGWIPMSPLLLPLVDRCRFGELPTSDLERLAVWCRTNTPASAMFIGPPGPKTFRFWSRRSLAFNRAGSPYHAAGLADWAARFQDHVGFNGTIAEFARAYLKDRQGLERRYQAFTHTELAKLARRQGASYVLAAAPDRGQEVSPDPLELLHAEGRYAVYRVRASSRLAGRTP